jgi:hypothetical protein
MLAYSAKQAHSGRTLDLRNITARPPTSSTSTGPPFKTITENLTSGWNKLKHGKLSADKPHYGRRVGRYFVATTLGDGFTIGKR